MTMNDGLENRQWDEDITERTKEQMLEHWRQTTTKQNHDENKPLNESTAYL